MLSARTLITPAQFQGKPGGPLAGEAMGLLCLVIGVFLVVVLVLAIFYLLTLQKALSRVSPRNRLMEPGMVWLMLIPCVNIIWQFMIAVRVPDSLRNEFRERGLDDGSDYGKGIALTQAILGLVGGVIGNGLGNVQGMQQAGLLVSSVMSLAGLVLFIMFWVKVANYSNQLASGPSGPRGFDRGFDDYGGGGRDYPRGGSSEPPPETYRPDDQDRYR
jgi:hypothetical protein